ncbi:MULTISPECIES: formyltransferase family protein [unclassified Neisseria]|uniref:formyltransferase family protein n=1 Tax=unclassified Neisseria TaxID=2623750 RepID=UPI0010723BC4|nr:MULTISPECIES: formyltransferase family protein [unclassified Neisseria]MBF0803998.1 formyl transferase [Neisseria sp. 19428wB4_WF04]TFU43269.1 formyl transferase [Neisseria sp. WF04]
MTKILFMGRKKVSAALLEFLSAQSGIEIVGVLTDSHLQGSPTAAAAKRLGLPLYTFDTALEAIRAGRLKYDLGLSLLYWRKLRDEFLTAPARGTINFHPAILPEYKGTGGYNLAIMDGLSEWGISAHYIDDSIDTGDLIEVVRFAMNPDTATAQSLERESMQHLEQFAKRLIMQAVESETKLPAFPNIGGGYTSRAEMEAMKEIRPGDDVGRKVRAFWFPPYDGAYIEIGGRKYTLIDRRILEEVAPKDSTSLFAGSADA